MGEFGEKFRKAREKKELSLDDVSNVTKINARMLRAIEEEHFEDLPGGVFNKGFIRAYAKHLGLDAEEAVSDYLASLRQAQIIANEIWDPKASPSSHSGSNGGKPPAPDNKKGVSKPAVSTPAASVPSIPLKVEDLPELQLPRAQDLPPSRKQFLNPRGIAVPWKIVGAAALVVALAVLLWVRHSNRTRAVIASSSTFTSAPAAQPAAPPASQPVVPAATQISSTPPPAPIQTSSIGSAASSSAVPTTQPGVQPQEKSTPAKFDTPPSVTPASGNSSDVTVKNLAKVTSKPAEKPVPLSLIIRADENSWISIYSDGQLVTQETLIAPAHTSVRASREISVRVGNAAGVTFVWNGKEIRAQGAESEVKTFVFDSSGMRDGSATGVP